jgi:hypothetical protein
MLQIKRLYNRSNYTDNKVIPSSQVSTMIENHHSNNLRIVPQILIKGEIYYLILLKDTYIFFEHIQYILNYTKRIYRYEHK